MYNNKRQGVALISTLIFLAVVLGLISIAILLSISSRQLSSDNLKTIQAQLAAEAGVERVIYETWHSTLGANLATKPVSFNPTLSYFKNLLNNYSGTKPDGSSANFTNGTTFRFTGTLAGGASFDTTVEREDQGSQIFLNIISLGTYNGASRRMAQRLSIAGGRYKGTDFALLTNNVNCIFCHTRVTSIEAAYKSDGSLSDLTTDNTLTGTERVKVGVLENLILDKDGGDSLLTGTIYTRGSSDLSSSSDLKTVAFQTAGTPPSPTSTLTNTVANFTPQNCAVITCTALSNSYSNYPASNYPDGELPGTFPAPIPDTNGNKQIDNSEWQEALDNEEFPGTLSGGSIKYMSTTVSESTVSGKIIRTITPDPSRTLQDKVSVANSNNASRGVAGNLVLNGSPTPLNISGTLYVDGDVVIKGAITGNGKIVARGNVYIAGDVRYACGSPANASNCNYGDPDSLPKFGLVAGGNTLLGPYMNRSAGDSQTLSTNAAADIAEFDDGLTDKTSFSAGEAALFNLKEYDKAVADPTYIPRFYRLRPELPIWRCEEDDCRKPSYDELVQITATSDPAIFARAAVVDLSPTSNWLAAAGSTDTRDSERVFKGMWADAIESGRLPGALQLDGILYSNNAIFTIAPKSSNIKGSITLNGSLIAADTGVLVTGEPVGLRIHYDRRLEELLNIRADTINLGLTRSSFAQCKLNDTNCGGW